jgi:hypothetical protein
MFQAQLLIVGATNATTKVFSPWMERRGDNLRVSAELVAVNGATITVKVYSKSKETPGDGTLVSGTNIALNSTGRDTKEYTGLNELVRYGFECSGSTGDWALFRALSPVWFDSVKTP